MAQRDRNQRYDFGWNGNSVKNAVVTQIDGAAFIEGRAAEVGDRLRLGEQISTEDPTSTAELTFADGTRIVLAGESTVSYELPRGQMQVTVSRGHIAASVQPQPPNKPLTVVTDDAVIEVLGTELVISATGDATRLQVNSWSAETCHRFHLESTFDENNRIGDILSPCCGRMPRIRPKPDRINT